ncbi:cytochrome PufQ [Oceaniglobus roseus]|uniref:cytochrome PufQ n=1 Tax=Oceaniglobus roseus TaxID=1737570 RepID=UPI000C7F14E7|nr:cytochrome PufQ [Kandeliimicrobium roseum]
MSDFTSDSPMHAQAKHQRAPRAEFYAYFAIIFLATLPLSCLTWALSALRQMTIPRKGPIARAWSQARIITPMIFSA